ncbi:MAG: transposase [Clostridiales Family XIII bacterium]|jgi:putative transposase|nr:transposase [Clostridiales Family XIII bacterium]
MKVRYNYHLIVDKDKQRTYLNQSFGCIRKIWNLTLSEQIEYYKKHKKHLSDYDLQKELKTLRNKDEYSYLKDCPFSYLQYTLRQKYKAWNDFFAHKKGYPRFKSKWNGRQTLTVPQNKQFKLWKINDKYSYIRLPKLNEPIKVRMDRELPSKPSSLTVIKNPDNTYEISFVLEKECKAKRKTKKSIGLKVGLRWVITGIDSDNKIIQLQSEKDLKKNSRKLKRQQRKLDRKKRQAKKEKRKLGESKNYQKQRVKVAKTHSFIKRKRKDYIEKLTSLLVFLYDNIVIEDISVKDLIKQTKKLTPRKKKRNINRTYVDISLGLFFSKLKEKVDMYGKSIIIADKYYKRAKICNNCGS